MTNPHLLPFAERERYNRLHDLKLAITRYKATRTAYTRQPSGFHAYHLTRAEHTLVNATRLAVTAVDLVTRRQS